MQEVLVILLAYLVVVLSWLLFRRIKARFNVLQRFHLPSSLLAGAFWLFIFYFVNSQFEATIWLLDSIYDIWSSAPAMLINVVFACLFLGKKILGLKETWHLAGPQIVFGQTLAWGQYLIGGLLTLLVLAPVFGVSYLAAALIEISFEGGHGTAAGLAPLFEDLGFAEGADMAVGLATVGLIMGIVSGILIINLAKRRYISGLDGEKAIQDKSAVVAEPEFSDEIEGSIELDKHWSRKYRFLFYVLQVGFIVVSIILGRLMLDGLISAEGLLRPEAEVEFMSSMPLFPLAMLGGVLVQLIVSSLKVGYLIDRTIITKLGSYALDALIVTAIATVSLSVIADNIWPFVLLALAGIIWNVFGFLVLARRIIPKYWFERGIGDYGQSMGMTATGLLLMRVADPTNKSSGIESFGYKQLFFEPVVGGGLFTATSMIIIAQIGIVSFTVMVGLVTLAWLLFGLLYFGKK